jgi:hypothetical protein
MAKHLRYFVPMGKDIVIGRIRKSINAGTMPDGNAPAGVKLEGWVSGGSFSVWVGRRPSRNPALPILRGKLEEVEGGTIVRARLGWTTFATGTAIVSITAVLVVTCLELAGYHVFSKEGKTGRETIIPLVFVLMFLIGFFSLGSVLAQPQEEELCKWLERLCTSAET